MACSARLPSGGQAEEATDARQELVWIDAGRGRERVALGLTQRVAPRGQHLADTLGMSLVHTNKTLKRLTASKVIRWKDKVFEILDRETLAKIAKYDDPDSACRPLI